jgi:hypothetical protein
LAATGAFGSITSGDYAPRDTQSVSEGTLALRAARAETQEAREDYFESFALNDAEVRELFAEWACPGNPGWALHVLEPDVSQSPPSALIRGEGSDEPKWSITVRDGQYEMRESTRVFTATVVNSFVRSLRGNDRC